MMDHPLTWAPPRPLWRGAVTPQHPPSRAPSILRFASDDFMDQLLGILATDPSQLGQHVARHETWRTPDAELATADLIERVPLPVTAKKARLGRMLGKKAVVKPVPQGSPTLKLYQPAHQRFYIAAATLACAIPGMPDRAMRGSHEKTGFVLRRLMRPKNAPTNSTELVEFAYIKGATGNVWQRVSAGSAAVLAPAEEILPVFPLNHADSRQISRTLWGGLIPVGRREEYLGAAVSFDPVKLHVGQSAALGEKAPPATPAANSVTARMTEFKMDVAEPWKALIRSAQKAAAEIKADLDGEATADQAEIRIIEQNMQYQMQSWLLLVDMNAYLKERLRDVWEAINDGPALAAGTAQRRLFDWLSLPLSVESRTLLQKGLPGPATTYPTSLADALKRVGGNAPDGKSFVSKLEAVETQYRGQDGGKDWPTFHCLLAGIGWDKPSRKIAVGGTFELVNANIAGAPVAGEPPIPQNVELTVKNPVVKIGPNDFDLNLIDKVTTLFVRALPRNNEATARPLPFAQRLSQTMRDTANDGGLFLIRFVHLNEDCGPLHPPTLSEGSDQFHLASFFDSDAPAREIRISLPTDTTPAGLRKHARGTAFVMSDLLCGQVQRAKGLGFVDLVLQVLPWPFHKDISIDDPGNTGGCRDNAGAIGMICSLSIPIITICALILLIMIVLVLDFIFRWIPWFIMCFPIPGLKGKVGSS